MKPTTKFAERKPADARRRPECPDCDSTGTQLVHRRQSFRHGRGQEAVDLSCEVPVHRCKSCGYEWTGADAEDARQAAVCRHLGRLTPKEVRGVREMYQMSQAEFSRVTGLGEASLSRWETGAQVQNVSSDRLLRLILADERNLRRLRQLPQAG